MSDAEIMGANTTSQTRAVKKQTVSVRYDGWKNKLFFNPGNPKAKKGLQHKIKESEQLAGEVTHSEMESDLSNENTIPKNLQKSLPDVPSHEVQNEKTSFATNGITKLLQTKFAEKDGRKENPITDETPNHNLNKRKKTNPVRKITGKKVSGSTVRRKKFEKTKETPKSSKTSKTLNIKRKNNNPPANKISSNYPQKAKTIKPTKKLLNDGPARKLSPSLRLMESQKNQTQPSHKQKFSQSLNKSVKDHFSKFSKVTTEQKKFKTVPKTANFGQRVPLTPAVAVEDIMENVINSVVKNVI